MNATPSRKTDPVSEPQAAPSPGRRADKDSR